MINKFKAISVAVCFAVTALWTEIQGADEGVVNKLANVARNIHKIANFDSDTALTTTEFLVYESSKDLQREEDKKLISNLNDRLFNMEQERQTFTRILDQVKQESSDLRQLNANLTDKLENLSQQFTTYLRVTEEEKKKIKDSQEKERRKQQEIFTKRGSKIDEYINQYKLLGERLTYGDLGKALGKLNELYADRNEEEYLPTKIDLIPYKIIAFSRNLQRIIDLYPQADHWMSLSTYDCPEYRVYNILLISIRNLLKDDISETMALYKWLNGEPHPRWDEVIRL